METVLAAFVVIFVILFAVFTLSDTFLTTQDSISESWQDMEARREAQAHTTLRAVEAHTASAGTIITLRLANDGTTRLVDFDHWDVILQYYDAQESGTYRFLRLAYAAHSPAEGQWTVEGLYAEAGQFEVYEPNILNPGEEIVLRLIAAPGVGAGSSAQVTVSSENGSGTSTIFTGNRLPVLATNTGLTITTGGTALIDNQRLSVTDADDPAGELTYTILAVPAQGSLSLPTTFTQQDIADGRLSYTQTGSGPDSFQFSVSDGKDTIGAYTFDITPSVPPVLVVNRGITLGTEPTVTIDNTLLQASDADDLPTALVYTILHAPVQGNLSLGDTFTQADIDGGLLTYTHSGIGSDSFQFTVSDGEKVIGAYNFNVTG